MSRATVSKSRADKAKDKDKDRGGSTSVPVPPVNSDVIPGRFTESDWNFMLDKEDGEDFIVDIVGNIVDSAVNVIYENYIQKQLYPYTVTQARDAILQIIEWRFLARDEGETKPEEDSTWLEEEEPLPCVPDAWAQGSVPQHDRPLPSPPVSEQGTDVTEVSAILHPPIAEDVVCGSHADVEPDDLDAREMASRMTGDGVLAAAAAEDGGKEELGKEEQGEEGEKEKVEEPPPAEESPRLSGPAECADTEALKAETAPSAADTETKPDVKAQQEIKQRRTKFKPHKGRVGYEGLRNMHKTLDEMERELAEAERKAKEPTPVTTDSLLDHMPSSCHSILKVQAGRPPGSKDVTYDDRGNVISVIRLDPEKLPSHRVRTHYAVVDPAVEAAHARLVAMRTGRYISQQKAEMARQQTEVRALSKSNGMRTAELNKNGVKPVKTAASAATLGSSQTLAGTKPPLQSTVPGGGVSPLPAPLVESMDLSPGVVVKEGNRVKRGPKPQLRYHDAITSAKLRSLRPVNQADMRSTQLAVADIIGSSGPLVRPLPVTDPIPPIATRPTPPPKAVQTA